MKFGISNITFILKTICPSTIQSHSEGLHYLPQELLFQVIFKPLDHKGGAILRVVDDNEEGQRTIKFGIDLKFENGGGQIVLYHGRFSDCFVAIFTLYD